MKIAITGHRPDAFLVSHIEPATIIRMASDTVCVLKREFGEELQFNLGGAIGVDQWVGMACIEQNVNFHLYLPFKPDIQGKFWTEAQQTELSRQMARAMGIDILEATDKYDVSKYQERNIRMIENSDIVVAFWVGKRRGGTFNAIQYALGQSKQTFNALKNLREPLTKEDLKRGWVPKGLNTDE